MTTKVVVGVVVLWVLVAIVSGTQAALAGAMQGSPTPMGPAVRTALINFLPWIPATLLVVGLTVRFPFTGRTWRRVWWIHLLAAAGVVFLVNLLVVLGFWLSGGQFLGFGEWVRQGLFWSGLRAHVGLVLYAAIAGVTQAVLYYRDARARELRFARLEGQLARARLQALNAQIRPHFLFNTLHTIGQLWRSGRAEEADALLDHLGSLFQRVQSTADEPEITLEEELRVVRDYLAIEQTRFRDRLRVEIDVPPEASRCAVPPLLLQPLVENAIRHGISATSSAGRVEVVARVEDGSLVIVVNDDGPGAKAPDTDSESGVSRGSAPTPGSGTGLSNTRERLAELYGDRAGLETQSLDGHGFRATVRLPAGAEESPGSAQGAQ